MIKSIFFSALLISACAGEKLSEHANAEGDAKAITELVEHSPDELICLPGCLLTSEEVDGNTPKWCQARGLEVVPYEYAQLSNTERDAAYCEQLGLSRNCLLGTAANFCTKIDLPEFQDSSSSKTWEYLLDQRASGRSSLRGRKCNCMLSNSVTTKRESDSSARQLNSVETWCSAYTSGSNTIYPNALRSEISVDVKKRRPPRLDVSSPVLQPVTPDEDGALSQDVLKERCLELLGQVERIGDTNGDK